MNVLKDAWSAILTPFKQINIKSGKNAPKGGISVNIELFSISIHRKHDKVLTSAKTVQEQKYI